MAITLKRARLLSEMTQVETARKLGVHRQTYMRWEKNPDEIPVGKAKEVSILFDVGVDELFFNRESTLSR